MIPIHNHIRGSRLQILPLDEERASEFDRQLHEDNLSSICSSAQKFIAFGP